jgi:hypothetical protein
MTFRGTSIGSKAELGALAGKEGQPMGGWSQGIGQASNPVGDLPLALGGSGDASALPEAVSAYIMGTRSSHADLSITASD